MRSWLLFVLLLPVYMCYAGGDLDVNYLREEYYRCVDDAARTDALHERLVSMRSEKAVVIGFIGALEALKAKHAWNPYRKMEYLARASTTLEKAIMADPGNIEIRFLRYTVEYFVPAFLGYSKHLKEDKSVIIQQITQRRFSQKDMLLIENIVKFLEEHKECSASELVLMRNALKR
jgi:hypothetical protein